MSSALFSCNTGTRHTCTLASLVTQLRLQASPAADKTAVPTRRRQAATSHPVDWGFSVSTLGTHCTASFLGLSYLTHSVTFMSALS